MIKILKNTLILLLSGAMAQVIIFLGTIYLARVLGPGAFGRINFASTVAAYFILVLSLGLPILGTRLIAGNPEELKSYVGDILVLRLTLAVLGGVLLLMLTRLMGQSTESRYLLLLYGAGLIPQALFLDWAFQGMEQMGVTGAAHVLRSLVYVGLVFLMVGSSEQLLQVPCFHVLGSGAATFFLLTVFVRKYGLPVFRWNPHNFKTLMARGWSMGFALLVTQVFFNVDILMLACMKGDDAVGYYSAAYKLILLVQMARTAYAQAIYPSASRYYQRSRDIWKQLLASSTRLSLGLAVPMAVGGTILAGPIMKLIYGDVYDNGIQAFQILIWNAALICVNVGYVRGLLSCGREGRYAVVVTICAVFNIGANAVLIPPFGVAGAAVSTVITQALVLAGVYWEFGKVAKIHFFRYLFKPVAASAVMAVFLTWARAQTDLNVFCLIPGGVFIYGLAFALVAGTSREELLLIKRSLFSGAEENQK